MALKEDAIYVELSTRIQELNGAVGPDVTTLKHDVAIIQGEIPSTASSENKLATAADVNYIALGLEDLSGSVVGIQSVIPDSATSENKLATAADINYIALDLEALSGSVVGIQSVIPDNATSANKLATIADLPSGADYVQVNGNGVKTYAAILTELFSLLDLSKISPNSKLYHKYYAGLDPIIDVLAIVNQQSERLVYSNISSYGGDQYADYSMNSAYVDMANTSEWYTYTKSGGGTKTTSKPSSNEVFRIYY